jgi:hypothetical protein
MDPVEIDLPSDAVLIYNALYPTKEARYLTADLFAAKMPDGTIIDAGWIPENDPIGTYEVFVYRGEFENQLEPPFQSEELATIVWRICELARKYSALAEKKRSATTTHSASYPQEPYPNERMCYTTGAELALEHA